MNYNPAIDGLRAIAILIVMVSHYGLGHYLPGGFGVTLFFFISGYLITTLLLNEKGVTGTIAITAFYVRRFLRLAPALIVMVFAISAAYATAIGPISTSQTIAALLYWTNYYSISGGDNRAPLGILWSLAVEEHFYLIYPALLAFVITLTRRTSTIAFLLTLCAIVLGWRVYLVLWQHASEERTYFATDTRIDSILFGAILAFLPDKIRSTLATPIPVLFGLAAILFTFVYRDPIFRETLRYSLQGIGLAPVFCATALSSRYPISVAIMTSPIAGFVGRISYSLYLWHLGILFFFERVTSQSVKYVAAAALSFVVAAASYYLVERPFLRLKDGLRLRHRLDEQSRTGSAAARGQ